MRPPNRQFRPHLRLLRRLRPPVARLRRLHLQRPRVPHPTPVRRARRLRGQSRRPILPRMGRVLHLHRKSSMTTLKRQRYLTSIGQQPRDPHHLQVLRTILFEIDQSRRNRGCRSRRGPRHRYRHFPRSAHQATQEGAAAGGGRSHRVRRGRCRWRGRFAVPARGRAGVLQA